jgi:polyphosphate kinase
MNALTEPLAIEALYKASCAGVKIDLIIRGVCALRPGIPGVSENISVRSVVGRFLEHSRVCYFENGGQPELFCASADWMERNFFRRVEVTFPVQRQVHMDRIVRELHYYLSDTCQSWRLLPDGRYERIPRVGKPPIHAQMELLGRYAAGSPTAP